jgi:hypothetical protein
MVQRLPGVIWDMNNSELIRQATLECFFVHVRTLIEFLEVRPDSRDWSARDTLVNTNWTPTLDAALKARLKADWDLISQHLVDFSRSRVVDETGHVVVPPTDSSAVARVADDVLAVWDQYATESNHVLVPHRSDFWQFESKTDRFARYSKAFPPQTSNDSPPSC